MAATLAGRGSVEGLVGPAVWGKPERRVSEALEGVR